MTLIPGVAHAESKAKAEAKSETDAAKGESAKAGERAEETADGATEGAADDVVIDEEPPTPRAKPKKPMSPLNPKPNEFPTKPAPKSPTELDVLLGDIAALRSRVGALTTSLFSSKIQIVTETDGDDNRIKRFVVTLDEGVVFQSKGSVFNAEDEKIVYEHAVAPGHHVVGVTIERYAIANKAYKTWQTTRFSVGGPERKVLRTLIYVEDDSDMGEDFPEDQEGEYSLEINIEAEVVD